MMTTSTVDLPQEELIDLAVLRVMMNILHRQDVQQDRAVQVMMTSEYHQSVQHD
jgi:hypothetical protein